MGHIAVSVGVLWLGLVSQMHHSHGFGFKGFQDPELGFDPYVCDFPDLIIEIFINAENRTPLSAES